MLLDTIPGPITTTFTVSQGGTLSWENNAFFNGEASFCALQNGTIYSVFQQGAQPQGCMFIQLSLFSVSSCQGYTFSTVTGPTGPSGAVCNSMSRSLSHLRPSLTLLLVLRPGRPVLLARLARAARAVQLARLELLDRLEQLARQE